MRSVLVTGATGFIGKQSLISLIDKDIQQLMNKAEDIHENQDTIEAARIRRFKGNPPGKKTGSSGDEIVWELLLKECMDDDLVIVSEDGDWKNIGQEATSLHPFIEREWQHKSKNTIKLFCSLGEFVNSQTPQEVSKKDIQLEKEALFSNILMRDYQGSISNLVTGPSGPAMPSSISGSPGSWLPFTIVGTNDPIACVNCGQINPASSCMITMRGYYCKNCSNLTL